MTSGFTVVVPFDGPPPVEWEILATLRRIEEKLRATSTEPRDDDLLDRRQVAARLCVSIRWVERHLIPTSQPRRGGRAWYSPADVEKQMRALRPDSAPRGQRGKAAPNAGRRPHTPSPTAEPTDKRARQIEAELRRDLERRR